MGILSASKYCIGWIPHIDGFSNFSDHWWDIVNDKEITEGGNKKKEYFQIKKKGQENHPFNSEIIKSYHGCDDHDVQNIVNHLKDVNYVAQCRSVDDTDKSPQWFFVYTFKENNLAEQDSVYIFFSQEVYPGTMSKKYSLRYLATVKVVSMDDFGFITLTVDKIAKNVETRDPLDYSPNDMFLRETFFAIRDVLHLHTHHPSTPSDSADEIPDCISNVIMSNNLIDSSITDKLLNEYKSSLEYSLQTIADKTIRLERKTNSFYWKRVLYNNYWTLASHMKQAGGIEIYARGLLSSSLKRGFINEKEYEERLRSLRDMSDALNTFYEDLGTRFQILEAKGTDKLLLPALILTLWILYFEAIREYESLKTIESLIFICILTIGVIVYCNSNY
jgi:hypothetical protein